MAESMTNVTEFSFPWGHHCPLLLYEWKHTVDSHWFTITPPVGQGWNCTLFVFNTLSYFQFMELNEGVRSHGSDIILNMRNTSQMGNNLLLWGYFRKPRWHISKRIAEVIEAISLQLWLLCAPLLNITTAEMRPWGSLSLRKCGNWMAWKPSKVPQIIWNVMRIDALASAVGSCGDTALDVSKLSKILVCPQGDSPQLNLSRAMLALWAPKCK